MTKDIFCLVLWGIEMIYRAVSLVALKGSLRHIWCPYNDCNRAYELFMLPFILLFMLPHPMLICSRTLTRSCAFRSFLLWWYIISWSWRPIYNNDPTTLSIPNKDTSERSTYFSHRSLIIDHHYDLSFDLCHLFTFMFWLT